jgi:hypothetical protein
MAKSAKTVLRNKKLMRCRKCNIVYFRHEDGWDIYKAEDCYEINGHLVPQWFDNAIVEDAPSKKSARQEWESYHIPQLGICLV